MPRSDRIHAVASNTLERSPRRLAVYDTETWPTSVPGGELHSLRLWCGSTVQRVLGAKDGAEPLDAQGYTAEQLTDWLVEQARPTETLWVYSHNANFDLTVSQLPCRLLARGWSITSHALYAESPWFRASKGSRRLTAVDSFSWLPYAEQRIAEAMGRTKLPLPEWEASDAEWFARCREDVNILRDALLELLAWWDASHNGNWSITGVATGMNVARHRLHLGETIIDPDPQARAFERGAILGGRRDLWRWGQLTDGPYVELDFRRAHCTVVATQALPIRRLRALDGDDLTVKGLAGKAERCLARVELGTTSANYPCVVNGRVYHAEGHFVTTLAGPELASAIRWGAVIRVLSGYEYLLGQYLAPWARWVLSELDTADENGYDIVSLMIKAWSQRVPSKWAGQTSQLAFTLDSPYTGWRLEHGWSIPRNSSLSILHLGGRAEWWAKDIDQHDSFPAILAWVQSHTRLALNRLINHIGEDAMVQCNTDSVICMENEDWPGSMVGHCPVPLNVQVKGRYNELEAWSPVHLFMDDERRLAGVPRSAAALGQREYGWLSWPKLKRQLEHGAVDGYLREDSRLALTDIPLARRRLPNGTTAPCTVNLAPDGTNYLVEE